jgi:hypothetical protein
MATAVVSVVVTPRGPKSAVDLEALAAAVPRDLWPDIMLGVTLASDVTGLNGHGQVVRTFTFTLTPAFDALFPPTSDQTLPFYDYMRTPIAQALNTPALGTTPVV